MDIFKVIIQLDTFPVLAPCGWRAGEQAQIKHRLWVGRAINKQCPRLNSGGSWRGHLLSTTSKGPLRQAPRCYYYHLKSNIDHGLHHTHGFSSVQLTPPLREKPISVCGIYLHLCPTPHLMINPWE